MCDYVYLSMYVLVNVLFSFYWVIESPPVLILLPTPINDVSGLYIIGRTINMVYIYIPPSLTNNMKHTEKDIRVLLLKV